MKKLLLMVMLLSPIASNADDEPEITLPQKDIILNESNRNEASCTNFTAELLSNGSIKV